MKDYINNVGWNDFLLESIEINYDRIVVVTSIDDKIVKINCNNFISIQYIGQWDENVISMIKVYEDDNFCQESRLIVNKNNKSTLLGGGIKNVNDIWYHLQIELIDRVNIHIVCTDIKINKQF